MVVLDMKAKKIS